MKKSFLSLFIIGALFSSCSNDDSPIDSPENVGELTTKLSFEEAGGNSVRAALSTAIPITNWNNIKQVQMFLYDAAGKVAYSQTITPTASNLNFTWTNIPIGTNYNLAIVANAKSSSDNIYTSLDGGANGVEWGNYNVKSKNINSQIWMGLKPLATFPTAYDAKKETNDKPYAEASEIFTAYASNVTIAQGVTTDLSGSPLQLKRDVSLLRVRVDRSDAKLAGVNFAHANTSILIHRQPVGLGLKLGSFAGGIYATASNPDHIMVAASGASTFKTTDPTTTTHNPTKIIDSNFSLWRDIVVFPNATMAEVAAGKLPSGLADNDRKYFIMISARTPDNISVANPYKLEDGTILTAAADLFWWATVNEVFLSNNIREVNITIKSSGSITPPVNPTEEGGLKITVSAPLPWNSEIQSTNTEV
ncbi:FimB/Mfa2 family fimbrial subunit [Dysgonomonas sp. GY617]|uniref:FimB/Mfa2 family fimbrial subunit n=1 Tax=Dysgonomonas sp. GY617 TaxID=2780420 RepID=UPI001883E01F|nr:FimB/Mfa2 family fimbrial subunit [Dysgonomonas sp. GY617]MBF0575173.1 FimB/Mfa2 family fimbrial subunit [Dysgonomonas sp. GY617]